MDVLQKKARAGLAAQRTATRAEPYDPMEGSTMFMAQRVGGRLMRQSLRWLVSGLLLAALVLHAGLESKGDTRCVEPTVDLAAIGISQGGEFGVLKGIVKNINSACAFKGNRTVTLSVSYTESIINPVQITKTLKVGTVKELGPGKTFLLSAGSFPPGTLKKFLGIPDTAFNIKLRLALQPGDPRPGNDVKEVPL